MHKFSTCFVCLTIISPPNWTLFLVSCLDNKSLSVINNVQAVVKAVVCTEVLSFQRLPY